ncbi:MAG: glycoside hydrolase family 6 protein, partial [Actinomycetia bacterium]|nr:glycoside hydrolase family 6 protein [Actinomycetes bacterium]
LVGSAKAAGQVPVIVAYNLPNRDCGQYSAGGAQSLADYKAWIAGLATGIDGGPAVVILEPDGLGLIPNYTDSDGGGGNCTIAGADPADRFAALTYAVDTLKTGANTSVYLDATHSGWQNVGAAAQRLLKAGVRNADGFFLNASNYQWTVNQVFYGTWVSGCIALAEADSPADPAAWDAPRNCRNQYWNGGPATSWQGTGMDNLVEWKDVPFADPANPTADEIASLAWNTVGIDSQYASDLAAAKASASTHFVIDTSRNGQGPWDWAGAGYANAGAAQDWCNPPDRGIGLVPTTDTGNTLVDAYLWLKVPGESDGTCSRGSADGTDAAWSGITDPIAGGWFPQQAAQLISLANPALTRLAPSIPLILGTPEVGQAVTANPGTWSPAGVTFTYQWLLDGAPIGGATAGTYIIAATDAGHALRVTVTGALTGYTGTSLTSAAVTPVAAPAPTPTPTPTPSGNGAGVPTGGSVAGSDRPAGLAFLLLAGAGVVLLAPVSWRRRTV